MQVVSMHTWTGYLFGNLGGSYPFRLFPAFHDKQYYTSPTSLSTWLLNLRKNILIFFFLMWQRTRKESIPQATEKVTGSFKGHHMGAF